MDIYDSLEKNEKNNKKEIYSSYINSARKYSSQGFDQETVAELLQIDGCSIDISKKLSSDVLEDLPQDYEEGPPLSYNHVKDIVEKTILQASLDDLEDYFNKYSYQDMDIIKRIAAVRVCPTKIMIDQIHEELKPIVENAIISNQASVNANKIQKMSSREAAEKKLFGVWPIEYIENFEKMKRAEKNIVKKISTKSEKPTIIF